MSQIVKAIMATDTGKKKYINDFSPVFQDVFDKKEHIEISSNNMAKIYNINVTLGNQVIITDFENSQVDHIELAIQRTKRNVIEAIYGEFRQDFYQLEKAIYDKDFTKAKFLLSDFYDKMFENI